MLLSSKWFEKIEKLNKLPANRTRLVAVKIFLSFSHSTTFSLNIYKIKCKINQHKHIKKRNYKYMQHVVLAFYNIL